MDRIPTSQSSTLDYSPFDFSSLAFDDDIFGLDDPTYSYSEFWSGLNARPETSYSDSITECMSSFAPLVPQDLYTGMSAQTCDQALQMDDCLLLAANPSISVACHLTDRLTSPSPPNIPAMYPSTGSDSLWPDSSSTAEQSSDDLVTGPATPTSQSELKAELRLKRRAAESRRHRIRKKAEAVAFQQSFQILKEETNERDLQKRILATVFAVLDSKQTLSLSVPPTTGLTNAASVRVTSQTKPTLYLSHYDWLRFGSGTRVADLTSSEPSEGEVGTAKPRYDLTPKTQPHGLNSAQAGAWRKRENHRLEQRKFRNEQEDKRQAEQRSMAQMTKQKRDDEADELLQSYIGPINALIRQLRSDGSLDISHSLALDIYASRTANSAPASEAVEFEARSLPSN